MLMPTITRSSAFVCMRSEETTVKLEEVNLVVIGALFAGLHHMCVCCACTPLQGAEDFVH